MEVYIFYKRKINDKAFPTISPHKSGIRNEFLAGNVYVRTV